MGITVKGESGDPRGSIWTGQNHPVRLPSSLQSFQGEKGAQTLYPQSSLDFFLGLNNTLTSGPLYQLSLSLEQPGLCLTHICLTQPHFIFLKAQKSPPHRGLPCLFMIGFSLLACACSRPSLFPYPALFIYLLVYT